MAYEAVGLIEGRLGAVCKAGGRAAAQHGPSPAAPVEQQQGNDGVHQVRAGLMPGVLLLP